MVDYFFCTECKKAIDEFDKQYDPFKKDGMKVCGSCRNVFAHDPKKVAEFQKPKWLSEAIELENQGDEDQGLDIIFDIIDDSHLDGKFEEVDFLLHCLSTTSQIKDIPTDCLLGILSITGPAKPKLPSRPAFVEEARLIFKSRPEIEDADVLLKHLT
ncbi:MAG: hypothetical protein ACW987_00605 [Candidatus Thorarchaeota archaeon]